METNEVAAIPIPKATEPTIKGIGKVKATAASSRGPIFPMK